MTRIPVNGLFLNVEAAGTGRPLLLLHGFTGGTTTWWPLMDLLSPSRRVVAVDLLGHGSSDSPAESERYRVERQLQDLTALLIYLDIDEYDLLGYSMGGRLAMHLALAHGERVGSLVLESASPGIEEPQERAARIHADERLARMLESQGIEAFVNYWEHLPLFATQRSLPAEVRASLRRQRLESSTAGLAGSLRGFGAGAPDSLQQRLSELPPTLLIAGERDEKYTRLARQMAECIPCSQVGIVPDAGHTVHLERPDEFAALVLSYLQNQPQPGVARPSVAAQSFDP